ncbi:MAG: hypothetical protein AUG48_03405 [Actinobacteria bacterium 13_1_20CM_3_68_9]|nr:MAG: hypothetical protein AUG48_03405 [Actinobacteria bacterium 13_1_20CM_3_68_9]
MLTEHIAECARVYGRPDLVYFSAAKNKPHAVTAITTILQDGGLVTSQPVSMQTVSPTALDLVQRSNIKLEAFAEVQTDLRSKGVGSYIELIWPLPGETLVSFKNGIGTLCDYDAHTIVVYPHLLLHNTPLFHRRAELELRTVPARDERAEAEIVVATREVSEAECKEGFWFFYALHAAHNTRSLRALARYLSTNHAVGYASLYSSFAAFLRGLPKSDPVAAFMHRSVQDTAFYDLANYGRVAHLILHAERECFDAHLWTFVESQDWWEDPMARALFEVDVINRPYVYSNTPPASLRHPMEYVQVLSRSGRDLRVKLLNDDLLSELGRSVHLEDETVRSDFDTFSVSHRRRQYPFMRTQDMDYAGQYCFSMIEKIENIVPIWRPGQDGDFRAGPGIRSRRASTDVLAKAE